jgi:hypothetical protein
LLESEVQQVALPPARDGLGPFLVLAATEYFNVRILVEAIRIGAPARFPLALLVADQREHLNGGIGDWWTEGLRRLAPHHSIGVDDERLFENDVIA